MNIREFNPSRSNRINKLTKLLREQFGVTFKNQVPSETKLRKLNESAKMALVQIRAGEKKFQLEPEYAYFLGLADLSQNMLEEGIYAESPKYQEMKSMIDEKIKELLDRGYDVDEACNECMHAYRRDGRFEWPEQEVVLPLILQAAKSYVEACKSSDNMIADSLTPVDTGLNEKILSALAKECGVALEDISSYDAINQKLDTFAEVANKSREAVVGFLNGLDENSVSGGIQLFGRKIAERNKFIQAQRDAVAAGKKEFKVDGTTYPVINETRYDKDMDDNKPVVVQGVKGAKSTPFKKKFKNWAAYEKWSETEAAGDYEVTHVTNESRENQMFDDIIKELLKEEVDVEQAEVVMAVRALASDIQDQVERLGRMINEELPAIADQMRSEMGADRAQSFTNDASAAISGHLEAARGLKSTLDGIIDSLTGEQPISTGLSDLDTGSDLGDLDEPDQIDNIDADAGAASGSPLGRARVQ